MLGINLKPINKMPEEGRRNFKVFKARQEQGYLDIVKYAKEHGIIDKEAVV